MLLEEEEEVLPASVEVAEMAVEEEENLEDDDDEEDAATVRQLAGDDARASINRAMVSAMLPLLWLVQPILVDVQRRRV